MMSNAEKENEGSWTSLSPATLTFMLDRSEAADHGAGLRTVKEPKSPGAQDNQMLGLVEEHQPPTVFEDPSPTHSSHQVSTDMLRESVQGMVMEHQPQGRYDNQPDPALGLVEEHQPRRI